MIYCSHVHMQMRFWRHQTWLDKWSLCRKACLQWSIAHQITDTNGLFDCLTLGVDVYLHSLWKLWAFGEPKVVWTRYRNAFKSYLYHNIYTNVVLHQRAKCTECMLSFFYSIYFVSFLLDYNQANPSCEVDSFRNKVN